MAYFRPFKSLTSYISAIVAETAFFGSSILFSTFTLFKSQTVSMAAGWVIIGLVFTAMATSWGLVVWQRIYESCIKRPKQSHPQVPETEPEPNPERKVKDNKVEDRKVMPKVPSRQDKNQRENITREPKKRNKTQKRQRADASTTFGKPNPHTPAGQSASRPLPPLGVAQLSKKNLF